MIKSVTDIEQSKRLAEILPIESADMSYVCFGYTISATDGYTNFKYTICSKDNDGHCPEFNVPCWSLSALLEVIPKKVHVCLWRTQNEKEYIAGSSDTYIWDCEADNPIDACVELIEKLHKEGLLWQKKKS